MSRTGTPTPTIKRPIYTTAGDALPGGARGVYPAGMIGLTPYQRLPFQQRRELGCWLAGRYRQGRSMAALAEELGTSVGRVRTLLLDQGQRLRGPGGSGGRLRPGRQELAEVVARQYAQGASLVVLGERHDRPASTIRRLVLAGGGTLRARGGRSTATADHESRALGQARGPAPTNC